MSESSAADDGSVAFEEALNKTGNGTYNVLLVLTSSLILLGIGMDLFGFTLVVTAACDLHLTVAQKGILTSLPFVGIILASYVWGYVSDTKGRRFTLVIPLLISFALNCISSLANHWLVLGLLKFLSVCFSCAANSVTYTIVGETCVQRVRNKYMLLMTCLLLLAPAVSGVLTYPTLKLDFATDLSTIGVVYKPWRLLIIVLALPLGMGALAMFFFYESPKFLFNCGRKDEAMEVLKGIYAINHRTSKNNYKIRLMKIERKTETKSASIWRAVYEQSAPLFREPYLLRSLQLFYIVSVAYITNNSFLIWLPHIMEQVRKSLQANGTRTGNVCELIHTEATGNLSSSDSSENCLGTVEDNVVFTLIISQTIFSLLNFVLSYLPNHRRPVLLTVLSVSAVSGVLINLTPETISSVIFFMMFTCTCLGMGIMASYFVDLYPTSHRGMVTCLSIMVGRSSAFMGINLVGHLIFNYCQLTFYLWSLLVLTSVVAAWFLPPDRHEKLKTSN
ncbi:synaptic vesicle glycoprotein 2B isoform X1 [Bombyx mori]|uniref:Major facilitator superfamily (MFS) profile domain-containing protein n=1 Tax=Bombyx mori TaxID=7091 RepID=A0A8R1WJS3_BOMMO|nr:synaptic vesicle glycoprotein 2B isoform X2 [Bombyx mori]